MLSVIRSRAQVPATAVLVDSATSLQCLCSPAKCMQELLTDQACNHSLVKLLS